MKIETWLQPNCSDATIMVVDWTKRQILESYNTTSEGVDEEAELDRIKGFVDYLKSGYAIDINANGTSFFDIEYQIAEKIVKNKIDITDWEGLMKDFWDNEKDVIERVANYEDKLKKFAKGGYKKHATGKASTR